MASMVGIAVIWLMMVSYCASVTVEDIKECTTLDLIFGRLVCSSVNRLYLQCIVPGATVLHHIKLNTNFSQDACEYKNTFGFLGNVVWVNNGCSGEFFVCYEGVRVSIDYPVFTVTCGFGTTTGYDVDVVRGISPAGTNGVVIYIIIGIVILLLGAVALWLGCIVKRRHQRDKIRRIVEKRQASLNKRDNPEIDTETYGNVHVVTISAGSQSVISDRSSSIEQPSQSCSDYNPTPSSYECNGSVCSSRSLSGRTSVSGRMVGVSGRQSQTQTDSLSLSIDERLRNGANTPDILSVPFDSNIVGKSNRNMCTSQISVDNVGEVCDTYKIKDIPLERKLTGSSVRLSVRPVRYNAVEHSGTRTDIPTENGTMTLPIYKRTTKAIVHEQPRARSVENMKDGLEDIPKAIYSSDCANSEMNMSIYSHYQSIDVFPAVDDYEQVQKSKGIFRTNMIKPICPTPSKLIPEQKQVPTKEPKPFYFRPEPNAAIYAKVTKVHLRKPISLNNYKPNGTVVSFDETSDVTNTTTSASVRNDGAYASMETFKPISNTTQCTTRF